MVIEYLSGKLVKPNSIEKRDYQVSLADQAKTQNSLIVLPTGLGKTTIALEVILDILSQKKGGVRHFRWWISHLRHRVGGGGDPVDAQRQNLADTKKMEHPECPISRAVRSTIPSPTEHRCRRQTRRQPLSHNPVPGTDGGRLDTSLPAQVAKRMAKFGLQYSVAKW